MTKLTQFIKRVLIIMTLFNLVLVKPVQALQSSTLKINPVGPLETPRDAYSDDEGSEDDNLLIEADITACRGCLDPSKVNPINKAQQDNIDEINSVIVQAAFNNYSNSNKVITLVSKAREHLIGNPNRYIVRTGGKKKTYCYRAVKEALRASGLVPIVFGGSTLARLGVSDLAGFGFRNLLDDPNFKNIIKDNPKMAPKGAILVYETTKGASLSEAGHIEIKTENSGVHGYISVSETNRPTYGYAIPAQRKLIGVLIK
jgi:hypothetical protein